MPARRQVQSLLAGGVGRATSERAAPPAAVYASLGLLGMMVRMGIPLAAALIVYFSGGPLADAGFLYYLVVFYPVTLTAEIFLSRPHSDPE